MIQKIVAITQARMTSTRLPGKVMLPLGDSPVLMHVVRRLRQIQSVDQVVVATTNDEDDDTIVSFCEENKIDYFRGDTHDVLARYYRAAKFFKAHIVVRVTSDCPLVDPCVAEKVIQLFIEKKAAYSANNLIRRYPHGLDVEVMSMEALEAAFMEASTPLQREHVTPFIRENPDRFSIVYERAEENWYTLRVTLDEIEDYQLLKRIIELKGVDVNLTDLIQLSRKDPELFRMNIGAAERYKTHAIKVNQELVE